MNLAGLLPLQGRSASKFTEDWLKEAAPAVTEVIVEDDMPKLRERNEKLSGYLSVLAILRAAYKAELTVQRAKFASENPPPEKGGIKAWESKSDAAMGDVKQMADFLDDFYDVISKRISVTQTTLRSRAAEVSSFG